MKLTYEKFSVAPVKIRVLYIKKLLNKLNYNVCENFVEDKSYKKALKQFQINNGFQGNCMISKDVFYCITSMVPSYNEIWKNMK